ncbi:prephenate dehydratase [Paenibacillus urinalis]|uniref:Prephenate dehydratase n=1 Tax=Paenibacillus urinalis TaxID=521520 RepID=A0AAX3MX15_9BACL|nr:MULTISPECIES: prephenate dehydratase [Paenibacillus]WDH81797.1 prephenate dehydratase [Paenibacillus urinalis]WDH97846.1 prephenate dehydratase [Paenibacillus urinalis]WDI01523.1 prephenate dehydratase [Paenibacillus urinalis]GAK43259.1 prephenate dehydratase [Paenibacillus sp. TCA20]
MKRVAILPEGTVSHEALDFLLGDEPYVGKHFKLISDVFRSTERGESDYSVIPVENTIDGSVSLHMDWLVHEVDIPMQCEWVYPSIQNLIGDRDEFLNTAGDLDFTKIRKIMSHPVAIPQCQQFIRTYAPQAELESVGSTAEAVEIVKKNPGQGWAAIATRLAAAKHELDIMAERVTDHDNNYTRFVLIGPDAVNLQRAADHQKTSILITPPEDFPGALHQVLSAFAWRRLNLSRIESRPTKKKLGNYYFYIDVMESMDSVLLPAAISEIEALGCQVRVLGSYPCYVYTGQ